MAWIDFIESPNPGATCTESMKTSGYRPGHVANILRWNLVRDQGVGGSNPLSPTIYFQADTTFQNPENIRHR